MEKISLESPKTGSDLVLETLRDLGIDTIFGYPGGAVLPFYDAIYNFKGIRHILGRHEQGCLHELKVMLNQLESWVLPSSLADREQQMPLQGLRMP